MRIALKFAIIESGRTQREIGALTRIPEYRLSSIVRGWTAPRPDERIALQTVLGVGAEVFTPNPDRSGHR